MPGVYQRNGLVLFLRVPYALAKGHITIMPVILPEFDEEQFPFALFPLNRLYVTSDYDVFLEKILDVVRFVREHLRLD